MSVIAPSTANVTALSGQQVQIQQVSKVGSAKQVLGAVSAPSPTSCSTLIFNAVSVTEITGGLAVNFVCPVCGATWSFTIMFDDYDGSSTYDFNDLINTTFPAHNCSFDNTPISLFLAAHLDSNGFKSCMQKSSDEGANGIPVNWWQMGSVTT